MADNSHESVYDGLLDHHTVTDDSQWAFGQDFEDPLAGVDTTVPEGVDHAALLLTVTMFSRLSVSNGD